MKFIKYQIIVRGKFAFNNEPYVDKIWSGYYNGLDIVVNGPRQYFLNYRAVEEALGLGGGWSKSIEKLIERINGAMKAKGLCFEQLVAIQDKYPTDTTLKMGIIEETPLSSVEIINV